MFSSLTRGFRSYWASPDPDAMSDISDSGQETPRDSHSPLPPELVNGMSSLNLEEESHMPGTFSASSPLASDLHNGLAALSLDGTKSPNTSSLPPPAFDVVSRMNALSLDTPNNDHAEDTIANLITAATMTATSTDSSSHSKLFSSSDDAYPPTSAPSHTYRPLPLSDALQSVQATVNAPRAVLSPSCTPGRRFGSASSFSSPSPRRQSGSNQSPGSLQSTEPVCSPPQLNSVFTRRDKNELDDLEGINKNLQEQEELIFGDAFSSLDDEQQASRLDLVHTFAQKNLQRVTQYFEKATDRQKKARQRSSTSSPLKVEEELAERRKELHERLRSLLVKTDTIKLLRIPKAPVKINADYVHQSDFFYMDQINQVLVLLAVICNMVIGLSIVQCNFLIGVSVMLVKLGMSTARPDNTCNTLYPFSPSQDEVIAGMPNSLAGALKRFGAEGRFDSYATCPTCNFTNKGVLIDNGQYHYPETCTNRVVGESGVSICGTSLLTRRSDGTFHPIKPYLVNSFHDYLARCLGDPTYLECSKKAADDAYNAISSGQQHDDIQDVFDAEFTMDFKGPDGSLFVNRGAKIRLAFSIHTDFLNPNGITHRGPTQSIGVISCANLALDPSIRYLPEYLYHASIIPGPKEPDVDEMDHFVRPVIEKFATAWRPGLKVSQTADSKLESVVEAGIFLSVNDLPAARKVAGFQGSQLRIHMHEQYRDAETVAQRKSLFKQHGVHSWVNDLRTIHPHTREHAPHPNIHAAGHIYDFLIRYGPILNWWCFLFERLVGALQKINTNDNIGGVMESTIIKSLLNYWPAWMWKRVLISNAPFRTSRELYIAQPVSSLLTLSIIAANAATPAGYHDHIVSTSRVAEFATVINQTREGPLVLDISLVVAVAKNWMVGFTGVIYGTIGFADPMTKSRGSSVRFEGVSGLVVKSTTVNTGVQRGSLDNYWIVQLGSF
ncbi:hypothetical protein D9758_018719 [Tetrapyrgos nigripes]|uniref:Uncharacterized protein n=1 Tax=Tetrapyrgos nigripes TaxID=182062 RepID=A0A8H5B3D9_9AGAR|nr:hypothetical protein D9758_018719 [Tetrapyrgos nigripes]